MYTSPVLQSVQDCEVNVFPLQVACPLIAFLTGQVCQQVDTP
jgi:hypothetical protein